MAHAEQEADLETAEGYRQHIAWNKLVEWPQLVGLLLRLGASWCSDDAGLAAVGAYLVLQREMMPLLSIKYMNMVHKALRDLTPPTCFSNAVPPSHHFSHSGLFSYHTSYSSASNTYPQPPQAWVILTWLSGISLKGASLQRASMMTPAPTLIKSLQDCNSTMKQCFVHTTSQVILDWHTNC